MGIYNWFMAVFTLIGIFGFLYLLITGKAATRTLSKTDRVLYHIILVILLLDVFLRHTGLVSKY